MGAQIANNGPRHSPAVPSVMQVLEVLLMVWWAGAVGGSLTGSLFFRPRSYSYHRLVFLERDLKSTFQKYMYSK